MENKILELNTKVNVEKSMKLIDLNGKKISFDSTFISLMSIPSNNRTFALY